MCSPTSAVGGEVEAGVAAAGLLAAQRGIDQQVADQAGVVVAQAFEGVRAPSAGRRRPGARRPRR